MEWSFPIEVPWRVWGELFDTAYTILVFVRGGVVLHAPGQLDLGRSTRLANRAQRRALRAVYQTCAIPGFDTVFERCRIHHVHWWRHGGRTDLANLVPVCTHHHTQIHNRGWHLHLGDDRVLTVTLPDGTILSTGPPGAQAA